MCLAELRRQGLVKVGSGEAGIVLWRNPDRIVGADMLLFGPQNLSIRMSPEGYVETIPDLVAEIVSKNDSAAYVQRKVEDYLRAGVRVVWIIDPMKRFVTEHRPNIEIKRFSASDTLAAEDIVSGLRVSVAELFHE
jgi:Uma2 family endonuclease